MAFIVNTFTDEAKLAAYISPGTVDTYHDEDQLDAALDALTSETITVIMAKGIFYTMVLDADFGANSLVSLVAKGNKFTVIEETP